MPEGAQLPSTEPTPMPLSTRHQPSDSRKLMQVIATDSIEISPRNMTMGVDWVAAGSVTPIKDQGLLCGG